MIYLLGDSSLDNKHWFEDRNSAVNGYESIMSPAISKEDVAYWLNYEILDRGLKDSFVAVNCAVETSRIESRRCGGLLEHDVICRNSMQSDDILVVSVGGNDIALCPTPCTVANMLCLAHCTPSACINHCACSYPFDWCSFLCFDDWFCGCTTGCLASLCGGWPIGFGYFVHLFRTRLTAYLEQLLRNRTSVPSCILVCMIYHPMEYRAASAGLSWADPALGALGYNRNPQKLQSLIQKIYNHAIKQIKYIKHETGAHVPVIGVPLFTVLDGTEEEDYVARVEPSSAGGRKMARLLLDTILSQTKYQ